ncbi:DUF1385 domain-containing protein [Intestinimonas butyriciproducens]|uniref:DUF1385 domain-containing protein n=1 Tax=Intestinimonas butyriciproducens TaxID=1297617 RepID=UPI0026730815|nr:DUF1385 domain-containing protein [Intestinimonas butyriciproducens]
MPEKEPQSCATPFRTMIGGQALIEGIMMLGPDKKSIVVRRPDGGLEIKTEERKLIKDRHPILGWPFIRGVVNFCTSMYTGVTALMYSAEFYPEDEAGEEEPSRFEQWLDKKLGSEKAMSLFTTLAVILGMAFSVGLFFVLPTLLSGAIMYFFPAVPLWARNVVEGATRVVIFLGYLILCSKMKDIRRVFSYHGAEHKTIFCYEKGLELTVENVRIQPKHHPRCGTSFLFVVIVVSILLSSVVFAFWQFTNPWLRTLVHLALLPVVVGLTWEFNRYVGGHDNLFCRAVRRPGMAIQRWTTFEPDDSMIEVGIEALKQVLPKEKGKDQW